MKLLLPLFFLITKLSEAQVQGQVSSWYSTTQHGEGTYYGLYVSGGNCGLDHPSNEHGIPPEISGLGGIVAINLEQYNMGSCGMCVRIFAADFSDGLGTTPIPAMDAIVVDKCPECLNGDLDLGIDGDGRWDFSWIAIPCETGNNGFQFKFQGSNNYYLKVQPRITKCPVSKMELQLDGNWITGEKTDDNHYLFSGYVWEGKFPVRARMTSVFQEEVEDVIPELPDDQSFPVKGSVNAQFTNCGGDSNPDIPPSPPAEDSSGSSNDGASHDWFCMNPQEGRKGKAYTRQNCDKACDAFGKDPVCCDLSTVYNGKCTKASEVADSFCANDQKPSECNQWYCQNPKATRKGGAFTPKNCFKKCDGPNGFKKNPRCCEASAGAKCGNKEKLNDSQCNMNVKPQECAV